MSALRQTRTFWRRGLNGCFGGYAVDSPNCSDDAHAYSLAAATKQISHQTKGLQVLTEQEALFVSALQTRSGRQKPPQQR